MVYISVEDFYEKVSSFSALSREQEIACAVQMKNGDVAARERLIQSYLPMVAGHVKHAPARARSLGLVLSCQQALETAVDTFDFLQDSEPFSHRLSWHLRQTVVNYLVK